MRRLCEFLTGCIVAALFFCTGLRCSNAPVAGTTSGSETTNGYVCGRVLSGSNTLLPFATVRLIPSEYNPAIDAPLPDSLCARTDENGIYFFKATPGRTYSIEAIQEDRGFRALITGVAVFDGDTTRPSTVTLNPPGTLIVNVQGTTESVGMVYVRGTTRYTRVNGCVAKLDSIPAGKIPAVHYINKNDSLSDHVVRDDVAIRSNATTQLADLFGWRDSATIALNTTAAGANVTTTVCHFPILVKLSSDNFAFSNAQRNGEDLRFTKTDGMPLPHQIDQWDSANGNASVWVKLDTVYGNTSTQVIKMFWGNSHAMAQSGGGAVFDTTDGFTGVWHLSGTGTAAHDATFNQYHGVANSATAVAPVSGIIGNARHFDGMSGFIDLPGTAAGNLNFEENGQYTLSAWVWVDSLRQPVDIGASQTIFSKGEQLYNLDLEWQSSQWHMSEYRSGIGVEQLQSELPAQTGVWKFVCGVRNGSSMALYVDGVLVNDRTFITPWPDSRNPSWNATIGKIADLNARYFDGILDEVIASGVARTPDWIKLCYMNQRIDNKLVIMYR